MMNLALVSCLLYINTIHRDLPLHPHSFPTRRCSVLRFCTRTLNKIGMIDIQEPFASLFTKGMVTHETYSRVAGEGQPPLFFTPVDVVRSADGEIGRAHV